MSRHADLSHPTGSKDKHFLTLVDFYISFLTSLAVDATIFAELLTDITFCNLYSH